MLPLISLGLLALFLAIPKIDPLRKNIQSFRNYFDNFILLIFAFLLYIHAITLWWNLGYRFNFVAAIVPALGLLFYYVGVLLQHAKQNWFIGIRTPWTLSNETVWNKTHKLGARLFKGCALFSVLGLAFQQYAIWIILIPVVASALYLVVYSYVEFKKIAH